MALLLWELTHVSWWLSAVALNNRSVGFVPEPVLDSQLSVALGAIVHRQARRAHADFKPDVVLKRGLNLHARARAAVPRDKFVTDPPCCGFGNRMEALQVALLLAVAANRTLVLENFRSDHFGRADVPYDAVFRPM
jgi:hypothetical protein